MIPIAGAAALGCPIVTPRCPLCNGLGRVLHEETKDLVSGVPGSWTYARCTSHRCDTVFITPRPAAEDIPAYYLGYHTHETVSAATANDATARADRLRTLTRRIVRHTLRPTALWIAERLDQRVVSPDEWRRHMDELHLGDLPPGSVLEIGCGNGRNLTRLRDRGWLVYGQELDPEAVRAAESRGIPVETGPIEACWPGISFDAILFVHVVEHLLDLPGDLAAATARLKPGGRVVVITPNPDAPGHRWFGPRWRGLEPPRHLQLLPPATVRSLLEKCGLQILRTGTTTAESPYILTESITLVLRRLPATVRKPLARIAVSGILATRARPLRQCGEVCVAIARRPDTESAGAITTRPSSGVPLARTTVGDDIDRR